MLPNVLSVIIAVTVVVQVRSFCHKQDDIYFYGIYGPLYIQNHKCSSSSLFETRNYIEQKVNADSHFTLEDSNLGTFNSTNIPDSRATRIIAIKIINCGLTKIEVEGIRKITKLYNLTITGNTLESFDSSFIKPNNLRFQHLNLTNNNLKKVNNICLGLPTTKTIILSQNPLKNIDEMMFSNCLNLLYLDLSDTSLETIADLAFDKLSKLNELYLSKNNFKDSKQIYRTIPNLTLLDLSYNAIDKFDLGFFNFYPSLKVLKLDNNKLKTIDVSTKDDNSLRQLFISNNELSYINMSYFKELQTLDLSSNKIEKLEVDFFEHCTDLRHLYLQNNQLKDLPVGIFSPMDDLVQLDLSNNKLTTLDSHHLIPLKYLKELYLEGNGLETVDPYSVIRGLDQLKSISLSYPTWNCKKLSEFLTYCRARQLDCAPKSRPNFKTTNIQGISCMKDKEENTVEDKTSQNAEKLISQTDSAYEAVFAKFLELNSAQQKDQIRLSTQQINEINRLAMAMICLVVVFVLFITFKAFSGTLHNMYSRFRNTRHPNSIGINNVGYMSNMELLNPNNTQ